MKDWETDIAFYLFAAFVTIGLLAVEAGRSDGIVQAVIDMLRSFA